MLQSGIAFVLPWNKFYFKARERAKIALRVALRAAARKVTRARGECKKRHPDFSGCRS
jgi:hypothetical protein